MVVAITETFIVVSIRIVIVLTELSGSSQNLFPGSVLVDTNAEQICLGQHGQAVHINLLVSEYGSIAT